MSNYRRTSISGGTYFFTQVIHHRQPWLCLQWVRIWECGNGNAERDGIQTPNLGAGGAIAVTSQTGKIDTNGGQVSTFANIGNGGRVKLKADRSVAVGEINTYAVGLAGEAIVEAKFNRYQVKLSQNFHNENCCSKSGQARGLYKLW
jgi:hypothetical protein